MNEATMPVLPEQSALADAGDSSPVDLDCLKAAASEDRDRLQRIIDLFVFHTGVRLEELQTAIKQESVSDICAIAHKSLGSSRTCGMIAIVPPLEELQRIGQEGHLRGAEDQVIRAQAAFAKIKSFLEEYVEQLAA